MENSSQGTEPECSEDIQCLFSIVALTGEISLVYVNLLMTLWITDSEISKFLSNAISHYFTTLWEHDARYQIHNVYPSKNQKQGQLKGLSVNN